MDRPEDLPDNGQCLETVRALHKTVVALRHALEQSRNEILELKSKTCPLNSVFKTLDQENQDIKQLVGAEDKGKGKKEPQDKTNKKINKKALPKKHVKIVSPSEEIHKICQTETAITGIVQQPIEHNKPAQKTHAQEKKVLENVAQSVEKEKTLPKVQIENKLINKSRKERKKEAPVKTNTNETINESVNVQANILESNNDEAPIVKNPVNTRIEKKKSKKHIVDVKIDVNVFQKSKNKHISVTVPAKVADTYTEETKEYNTDIKDYSVDTKDYSSDTKDYNTDTKDYSTDTKDGNSDLDEVNEPELEDIEQNTYTIFDERDNSRSNHLEKNEFEDICDDTECDIDENSSCWNEELRSLSNSLPELAGSKESINDTKVLVVTDAFSPRKISKSLENLVLRFPKTELQSKALGFSKTVSYSNIQEIQEEFVTEKFLKMESKNSIEEANEPHDLEGDHEVDEVELIFTTDETKEEDFKEELVSIDLNADGNSHRLQCPLSEHDHLSHESNLSTELEDDVFNDNFENENQENSHFQTQTFSFGKENSNLYNSKSDNSINHDEKSFKSYYSYQDSSFENKSLEKDESFDRFEERVRIIETDISKIGIQDMEYSLGRRNTCPNPLQYKPILHREAMGKGAFGQRKARPILAHSSAARKESGAQTDISALPGSSWRSESNLIHKVKVGEHFTTLPSKYPMPGNKLRLSEKTVEARRVLLSDIGFTSMVPELSRSADHLCPANIKPPTNPTPFGQYLRTPDLYSPGFQSQKYMWNNTATATPSEGSHSQSRYSLYPLTSPPVPTRRCSAPVSPSRRITIKQQPSKIRFANGSLPELRGDWTTTIDSGDSTDSLVEEAEHYLRRSIDCIASGRQYCCKIDTCKGGIRRASAPEPAQDNIPPQGWQPFLPRVPRDLRLDHWVKVISPEGRVKGGRVRYVGPLIAQTEQFVGVQLSTPDGHSDGTYNNRRYFQCEPYHGIFVPFKKVVMGWRP